MHQERLENRGHLLRLNGYSMAATGSAHFMQYNAGSAGYIEIKWIFSILCGFYLVVIILMAFFFSYSFVVSIQRLIDIFIALYYGTCIMDFIESLNRKGKYYDKRNIVD